MKSVRPFLKFDISICLILVLMVSCLGCQGCKKPWTTSAGDRSDALAKAEELQRIYKRVSLGMTVEEVVALAGHPSHGFVADAGVVWIYNVEAESVFDSQGQQFGGFQLLFQNDRVEKIDVITLELVR